MLTEQIAESARKALYDLSAGRWGPVKSEIQDDGMFVLLTTETVTLVESDLTTEQRSVIATRLNQIAPAHDGQELGAWLVAFLKKGEVVASVYPGFGGL